MKLFISLGLWAFCWLGDGGAAKTLDIDYGNKANVLDDERWGGMTLSEIRMHGGRAFNSRVMKWPYGKVMFFIENDDFDDNERKIIDDGMKLIEEATCVTFTHLSRGQCSGRPCVHVKRVPGAGCFANLGMYFVPMQELGLDVNCMTNGTVVHELMHTLGFEHEHKRPDRDSYVKFHEHNLDNKKKINNFHIIPWIDMLGEEYDIYSIMHYPSWGFAIDDTETLTPVKPVSTFCNKKTGLPNGDTCCKMGQDCGMTKGDIRKINKVYRCWDK